jgi:Flp pilus assembly pilin Flp
MFLLIKNLIAEETGATMVEYALLIAFIGAALVVTITALKSALASSFTATTAKVTAAS